MSEFEQLHPSVQYHVVNSLGWANLRPTQLQAIAPIHAGAHCLLLAPTAGGKTEAAIIPVLSRMLIENRPALSVLYICPIKALLNNLEPRLTHYAGLVGRRVQVWHGDIGQAGKLRALRDAPDILLTTPESIEAMLISTRISRTEWFGNLTTVVVDELHAFAGDDRGWHLRSILHRLDQYLERPLQRIGLSATVSNPEQLLSWFAPSGDRVVVGNASVSADAEVTLDHVGSLENAATVIARLYRGEKRLVFCDSRSGAEHLSSLLREQQVRTFISHASLSLSERQHAEKAFAEEKDCVIVATSTLELGIDVGDLDRVIQIDSPSSVSSFLQRMGRTGRRADARRNCLFLTTNDNALLLALGVTKKWSELWVEAAMPPNDPWHIVAQQMLVSIVEQGQLPANELTGLLTGCFPELPEDPFATLLEHLIDERYLVAESGVVSVGARTEKEFGRGNYRDLLASFSGSMLLTGRHGAADIGYIDPTVLTGDKVSDVLLLLAGRSWRVHDIDWSKRIVWLEPVASGGKARWMGSPRNLAAELCEGIRSALSAGNVDGVVLSHRAKTGFAKLVDEIPASRRSAIHSTTVEDGRTRTWTFAGTRKNRTLARALSESGTRVRFDALGIDARLQDVNGVVTSPIELTPQELDAMRTSVKFSGCLPQRLLADVIVARHYVSTSGHGN